MRLGVVLVFMVAVSALALLSQINIVTLLEGSHTTTGLTSNSNDINCQDCHSRIQDQLSSSAIHSPKDGFDCEECHRMTKTAEGKTIKYATHNQSGVTIGNESHAAYTPRCLDCHGNDGIYYNDTGVAKPAPPAPAFNKSYGSDYSAHKPFVKQALNWGVSKGENEACIACHTNYSMELEFKRPKWFKFYVDPRKSDLTVSSISYGSTNTTVIHKPGTGAKHEFVEPNMNGIKCESCHSDIWQAANHTIETESNTYDSTNASHVLWQFESGMSDYDKPMHNATCVYSEYGATCMYGGGSTAPDHYDNITEYCTLSCHRPILDEENSSRIPAVFTTTTHAAKRLSCYDCHSEYYDGYLYFWDQPQQQNSDPDTRHDSGAYYNYSNEIYDNAPLFMHAETCISCKRDDAPSSGTYKTWTEPNNTMYDVGGGYYI